MRFISSFLIAALMSSTCLAAPIGGEVIRGSSDISYGSSRVEINQHTDRAVIDWRSFDVKAGEHVKFNLPNPTSVSLNRINDRKASEINGLVSSNGNLILLNPNGIVFGKDAVIDAAGIIASSSKVNIDEFMNGGAFGFSADGAGKIVNKGNISAGSTGLVGFVSPHIENHGVISAKLGKVQLASSDSYTIDLAGDGLINLAISDNQKQKIENNGKINADGGSILLTASAAREIIDSLIINNGKIEAKTGSIKIYAEGANAVPDNVAANKGLKAGQSTIINNGIIDASGKKGGNIEILADDIALLDNSKIDASGYTGALNSYEDKAISDVRETAAGGDIKIGGDYLGSGTTPAAKNIYVAPYAKIYADALEAGDAGRVIIWADKQNDFYGNIFVRGGQTSGDGGFVETSGKEKLNAHGYVTTLASNGKRGTYLLDPTSISIYGSSTGNWPKFKSTDGTLDLQTGSPLQLWLDAMDPLNTGTPPANNASVTTWYDKSGIGSPNNAGPLAGASAPTYKTTGLLGKPSLYFGGSTALKIVNDINPAYLTILIATLPNSPQNDWGVLISKWGTTSATQTYTIQNYNSSYNYPTYSMRSSTSLYSIYSNLDWSSGGTKATITCAYFDSNNSNLAINSYVAVTSALPGGFAIRTGDSTPVIVGWEADKYSTADYKGNMSEIVFLNITANTTQRSLLEQYLSAKWSIALNPLNNGHSEIVQATTDGGLSVFTTRYLERLAASADISLTAGSGGILLDLQGDTLTLPIETNLSLTTTASGDITNNSTGTIVATRTSSKGNITLNSNGNINFTSPMTFKTNGGDFTLSAGGTASVNTLTVDTTNNGALTTGNITINKSISATASSGNSIILAAGNSFNIGANTLATSGTARYLVYSKQASSNTPNSTPGGATSINGVSYPTIPGTAGNLYIYSYQPTLTFSPINQTVYFGNDIVQTAFSISGYVNGDVSGGYTGAPLLTSTTNSSSTIGHYANALSIALGTLVAGTYNVSVSGTHADVDVVVPPTPLSIVPDNKFKFYNWPNPPLTYKVYGLNPGDPESLVSGITLTSTAVTGSLPGVYSITPSGGTVAGRTYAIQHYIPGTLTVTKTPPSNKCPCLTALGR